MENKIDSQNVIAPFGQIIGKFIKTSRLSLFVVFLVILASSVVSVLAPYVFSKMIDSITDDR